MSHSIIRSFDHSIIRATRRGSALLIVLGMIAFMVISAVAFSAFMRNSRLPSSYLRRTSYSRLLVKAALAEAIDLIDVSIGDNPHPGVGTRAYPYPRRSTANEASSTRQRNYWVNRVFIGTNGLMNASDTVSTLTFESLAYLPPALINETRYYSRRSAAACWHNLGFDSGRYAFTAVDVSDHFDVNRTVANVGRNSSDGGKISLAYAFENKAHTGYTVQPSAWDTFMDQFVDAAKAVDRGGSPLGANQSASKLPLVSLADMNLAIYDYKKDWAETMSPFCRYVTSKGGTDFVTSSTGADSEMMRLMTFVTDGYYPSSVVPEKVEGQKEAFVPYDLNVEENQPFTMAELEQTARSARSAFDNPRKGVTRLYDSLCGLGVCALWDYLDTDNVPLSLAIPTTERVPMVCAIQPQLGTCKLKVTMTSGAVTPDGGSYPPTPTGGQKVWVSRTDDYKIDPTAFSSAFMGAKLNALVAFPFRRNAALANDTFKIDGRLSLFIGASDMRFRTDAADDVLHLSDSEAKRGQEIPTTRTCENGVFHSALTPQQLTFNQVNRTEDALREVQFDLSSSAGQVGSWLGANPLLKVTYRWEQTYTIPPGSPPGAIGQWLPAAPPDEKDALSAAIANGNTPIWTLPPLKRNGTVNGDYLDAASLANLILNGGGAEVKVYAGVWLRVRNSNGYLVDLVPACMQDDDSLNLFINNTAGGFSSDARTIGGAPYPLMRFDCTGAFTLGLNEMKSGVLANGLDVAPTPAAVMVGDPRYNYAPEHWFAMPGAYSKQEWLSNCGVGGDGRDRDIFMATSDAGYLQSPYEFAFLPRLTNLEGFGAVQLEGDYLAPDDGRVTFAANFSDARNHGFMWKTYRPYRIKGYEADDFEGTGFTAQGSGMRVNPYAATESVTLAALANSPNSWMVCATNENADCAVQKGDRKAENFNKKYCFNMMGPEESKFDWEDLRKIAGNLQTAMRRDDGDWEEGFRSLDWAGIDNEDVFAGVELSGTTCDLDEVDRKFLYGYWHDCFAPKQQLFLVFVRAEPMMMGGGAIGQTPPQLGARAVALVWRDPVKRGSEDGDPHSTRVLFYRQLD